MPLLKINWIMNPLVKYSVLRIKASTLIENLIALIILTIVMALCLELIVSVQQNNPIIMKMRAKSGMEVYADSSIENKLTYAGTWNYEDVHFARTVEPCKLGKGLTILHFTAYTEAGKVVLEERNIVEISDNEKN